MSNLLYNTDIRPFTTFGISARAACVAIYDSLDQLADILADTSLPRPFKHIGEGSNLLFTTDFPGTILISHISDYHVGVPDHANGLVDVVASAGMSMDRLCRDMALRDIWGLENLSGIPGSVGASAVQNVGAYGIEAGDLITHVDAIEIATGKRVTFPHEALDYGYRHSVFKTDAMRDRFVITHVHFRLSTVAVPRLGYANLQSLLSGAPSTTEVRNTVIAIRDSKLPNPATTGSAGSFFKNPIITASHFDAIQALYPDVKVPHFIVDCDAVKVPAAWLIDKAGCKAMAHGGASLWQSQPLVIVNTRGTATAADVVALERSIIDAVNARFNITLHPEVEHL